jgi:hypothetical protein
MGASEPQNLLRLSGKINLSVIQFINAKTVAAPESKMMLSL